jgi:hypothetical protein
MRQQTSVKVKWYPYQHPLGDRIKTASLDVWDDREKWIADVEAVVWPAQFLRPLLPF